jgi:hypothetical protein
MTFMVFNPELQNADQLPFGANLPCNKCGYALVGFYNIEVIGAIFTLCVNGHIRYICEETFNDEGQCCN